MIEKISNYILGLGIALCILGASSSSTWMITIGLVLSIVSGGIYLFVIFIATADDATETLENKTATEIGYDDNDYENAITAAEYQRGKQELITWLSKLVTTNSGEQLMYMDSGEKWKPSELLRAVQEETIDGKNNIEAYTRENRWRWKEHYSAEVWAAGKAKFLSQTSSYSDEKLDEEVLCMCGKHTTSFRKEIKDVEEETAESEQIIVRTIRWDAMKKD